jgi:DNA-binding MarR family transcriptional regulator
VRSSEYARAGAGKRSGSARSRAAPSQAQSRVAYSVGRLERAVRRELGRVTRRFGLTVAQYTALSVLDARGEQSNAQLARRTFVSPQAMNEIVQAMTVKTLLARAPHSRHGRIVVIRLTAKGERVLAQCGREAQRIENAMLARLSPSERSRLRSLLRSCTEALESGSRGPHRRGA